MAQKASTSARIDALEAAKQRIAALDDENKRSSKPMAELLGVTWNTLRGWCDSLSSFEGSGAFVRGGMGIDWEFDPRKTVDALLAHFRGEMERRQDRNRSFVASAGLDMDPSEASQIDMADLSKQVTLTIAIQEQKKKLGGYVPASSVTNFLRGYNQSAVEAVLGVGSKIDPTGTLPASVRAAMTESLRNVVVDMNERCSEFIRSVGAGSLETGDRGAM